MAMRRSRSSTTRRPARPNCRCSWTSLALKSSSLRSTEPRVRCKHLLLPLRSRGTLLMHSCLPRSAGAVAEAKWESHRLQLPLKTLKPSGDKPNVVRVVYRNNFDHTGNGFHRFVDPEDQQTYTYTNFEPFECHKLFPCFDQP